MPDKRKRTESPRALVSPLTDLSDPPPLPLTSRAPPPRSHTRALSHLGRARPRTRSSIYHLDPDLAMNEASGSSAQSRASSELGSIVIGSTQTEFNDSDEEIVEEPPATQFESETYSQVTDADASQAELTVDRKGKKRRLGTEPVEDESLGRGHSHPPITILDEPGPALQQSADHSLDDVRNVLRRQHKHTSLPSPPLLETSLNVLTEPTSSTASASTSIIISVPSTSIDVDHSMTAIAFDAVSPISSTPTQAASTSTVPPKQEPTPLSTYTCPICFSPPTNATLTPCGHVCCGACLFTAVKATLQRGVMMGGGPGDQGNFPRCPVCRANIPGWDGRGGGVIGLMPRAIFTL